MGVPNIFTLLIIRIILFIYIIWFILIRASLFFSIWQNHEIKIVLVFVIH